MIFDDESLTKWAIAASQSKEAKKAKKLLTGFNSIDERLKMSYKELFRKQVCPNTN